MKSTRFTAANLIRLIGLVALGAGIIFAGFQPIYNLFGFRHPAGTSGLPNEGDMPSLRGATGWLNSEPLTTESLRGKVVLVQFWTYTCINWLRTLPYSRAWAEKYKDKGLVVIGIHTPEFPFEHDFDNVRRSANEMGINYPVAIDNDYAVWSAFDNHYWPALYFVDAQGRIRHHQFGEGAYEQSEMVIQQLLAEAKSDGTGGTGSPVGDIPRDLVSVDAHGIEVAADWEDLQSGENYVGYDRTNGFSSPGGIAQELPHTYTAPTQLGLNHWALVGDWTVKNGAIAVNLANGRIVYRFHARDLHLVMGSAERGTSIRFRLTIDGKPLGTAHGADTDAQGNGTVSEQRTYQLVRQPGPITDHTFEIEFLDRGVEVFSFTFG